MSSAGIYKIPSLEKGQKILPNKLGLESWKDIEKEETRGFTYTSIEFTLNLRRNTRINLNYILAIHKAALEHLYLFAGKLRTTNITQKGFAFPTAKDLPQKMVSFQDDILNKLRPEYTNKQGLIEDIALVHAELLFLYPFRKGNVRTARLLADLMSYKAGGNSLKFDKLNNEELFAKYIYAIQNAGLKNYEPMKEIIALCMPI